MFLRVKISVNFIIQKAKQKTLSEALSMTMKVEINSLIFVKEKVSGLASDVGKKLLGIVVKMAIVVFGGLAMLALLLTYITKTITAVETKMTSVMMSFFYIFFTFW